MTTELLKIITSKPFPLSSNVAGGQVLSSLQLACLDCSGVWPQQGFQSNAALFLASIRLKKPENGTERSQEAA